jgi:membrane-bound lytic murein transglycosylase MltF
MTKRNLLPISIAALAIFLAAHGVAAQVPEKAKSPAAPISSLSVRGSAWKGDLDGMLKRRYIRALVVSSKTQYYVVKGVQRGAVYESLMAFQDFINRKYPQKTKNLKFHVLFIPVARDKLLSRLAEGRGDLSVAALTITPERQKTVDFSDPTVSGMKEIVVTGPNSPTINTIDDLSGQEVFVRLSSSYAEHLSQLNEKLKSQNKPLVKIHPAPEDLEDEDLLEMLNAGLVHVVVVDSYLPKVWATLYTKIQPHPEAVLSDSETFGWAMRKDSPKLMTAVNEFVKTHKQGTAFGNTIIRRYVDNPRTLKNAVAPEEIKKFNDTAEFFKKYAAQYKVDHLLMMAQGYQESGLNQDAKSHVGAIGVMQLMPATGKQMQVGDIRQTEANVHAGVKYVRYMVDQYYANEPMNDLNKLLFAFASYNAGPGRIRQLRKAAAAQGFDPNVWIDNVEVVAAAKIGTETVTYVSNIYKYYVAYKLVEEENARRQKTMDELKSKAN